MRPASLARVRRVWREEIGAPAAFQDSGVTVFGHAPSDETARVSLVRLGEATAVVVPPALVDPLSEHIAQRPDGDLTDPSTAVELVGPVARFLGPAALAFADDQCFRSRGSAATTTLPAGHDLIRELTAACGPRDTQESAVAELPSPISVVERDGTVVAASGYEVWSAGVAHIGVLTHPRWRGRGLATAVAGAAVARALDAGLVAQWRARTSLTASRRIARSLGFIEVGQQLSLWLA